MGRLFEGFRLSGQFELKLMKSKEGIEEILNYKDGSECDDRR